MQASLLGRGDRVVLREVGICTVVWVRVDPEGVHLVLICSGGHRHGMTVPATFDVMWLGRMAPR